MINLGGYGLFVVLLQFARFEMDLLPRGAQSAMLLAGLATVAIALRLRVDALAKEESSNVQFEDLETPAILRLGLNRDGASV